MTELVIAAALVLAGCESSVRVQIEARRLAAESVGALDVRDYGADGGDSLDDTAALQAAFAALDARPGTSLYVPLGRYLLSQTLTVATRAHRIVGDFGARADVGGSEIVYAGDGAAVQFGVDNGTPWDASGYDGPQDQHVERLWLTHGAPDTPLDSTGTCKAGSRGIWDWRGGAVVLVDVGLQGFDVAFGGAQSDVDHLTRVTVANSKYGVYLGPRSDQATIDALYAYNSDRALTVDGARGVRVTSAQVVGVGTAGSAAVEVRRNSGQVTVTGAWFEHLGGSGYPGTDQVSQVSAGEVDGYGPGGSVEGPGPAPNQRPVSGLAVRDPLAYVQQAGAAGHTRFLVSVGKVNHLVVDSPAAPPGISLSNFDALVGVLQAPAAVDAQVELRGVDSSTPLAKLFANLGGGSPTLQVWAGGTDGGKVYSSYQTSLRVVGAPAGADRIDVTSEGHPGNVIVNQPGYAAGPATRLRLARAVQHTSSAGPPTTGTWQRGDVVLATDPVAGGSIGWVCVAGGAAPEWRAWGAIQP